MRFALLLAAFSFSCHVTASADAPPAHHALAREIYRELIEIKTTADLGSTRAVHALAARLKAAGFDDTELIVAGPRPENQNLIVRLKGRGEQRPILFLGHLDVVEALAKDWSTDPFQLVEKDGYFHGRGTIDMKDGITSLAVALIRFKQSGYLPRGDIIVAFTDHEEGGPANGAIWLAQQHREWIDAEYGINPDAGRGTLKGGKPVTLQIQTAEKTYVGIDIEVSNPGGHSSVPEKENAIYRLTAALNRLSAHEFPINLNETTRAYFGHAAEQETGRARADMLAVAETGDPEAARRLAAASPFYNALLRTTCITTQLHAGHAENALPQTARATLNARILPNENPEDVRATLAKVFADDNVKMTRYEVFPAGTLSPLQPRIVERIDAVAQRYWPGVKLVPTMSTGATDSVHFRNIGIPVYGVSGSFLPFGEHRAHGRDERLGVREFYTAVDFMHDLMIALTK